jgi:hypothetical protein
MYMNSNFRFPIGDNGNDIDTIEVLSRVCGCNNRQENKNPCGCDNGKDCVVPRFGDNVSLAIVYSPDHDFDGLYDVETALERATLFKPLDKPFMGMTVSGGCLK